jgi:hypothetical protein
MFAYRSRCCSIWFASCLALIFSVPAVAQRAAETPSSRPPDELLAPVGTVITVQILDPLSSNKSTVGDPFVAALQQPLIIDGWVVARRGQTVFGTVASANSAGRVKGTSDLALELTEIVLVDGQQMPIRTRLLVNRGKETRGEDATTIAGATAIGTIIGVAAGGGKGALIGAAIGGGAATAGVLSTRGQQVEIVPESTLTFRLDEPLVVSTVRSEVAFVPVNSEDYREEPRLRDNTIRRDQHQTYEPYPPGYGGYPPPSPRRSRVAVIPEVIIVPSIIIDRRGGRHRR